MGQRLRTDIYSKGGRLETLTPKQIALMPKVRDEWLAHGLSTEPADRREAEKGFALAYETAGLAPPKIIVWLDSPLAGCIGATMICQVRDQVGGQVGGQVGDQVWGQVRDQVWGQVGGQVSSAVYGQHDAGWLAFYDFFQQAAGLEVCTKLNGINTVARAAGWWWPFENLVIATERPRFLARDAEGRLHSGSTAAILYPDGWGVWAWHGVRVPQKVIEAPGSLTAKEIQDERNVEVRRIMLDRYGTDRYLQESNAKMVHKDDWGELWKTDIPDDEVLTMVKVVNSTPEPDGSYKDYWLRVPPRFRTAQGAIAWTFGESKDDYKPLVET